MAVPVLAGRGATREPASPEAAAPPRRRARRFARAHLWTVLLLAIVALGTRVYTTNSLAGEPTSDEYLYAVHARDLARQWSSGEQVSLEDLSVEGRSVAVESAALSFVLPWDPLTVGRTMQAVLNALCVPLTFVLGRQIGLTRSASLVGALLLMAVPEFQEDAWRFWTDSQATFLCLVYLSALVGFIRRPGIVAGVLALVSLGALLLTKESAAVTFAPFIVLAGAIPLSRRLTDSARKYALLATVMVVVAFVGVGVFLTRAPGDLARNALVQKTIGAGPLIFSSVRDAIPRVPEYSAQLVTLIGPTELGPGFLWATLVGFAWLMSQSILALVTSPRRQTPWVLGWVVAVLVWTPAMVTPSRDLASLHLSDPWVAVAAASVLVAVGTAEQFLRNTKRPGWGLALLGLVVIAVLAERLVIAVTPKVSTATLSFRLLMPIVPLFALVAGGGVWAAAGALALLVPTARSARAGLAVLAGSVLVIFWSPLLRDRFSTQPLLGRVADRGADASTPQGLRVEALVQAQDWLRTNLQPGDLILTGVGISRHVAWYADLGVDGMTNLIDLNSQPRNAEQQRQYILDRVGPHGVNYVIEFNVNWTDPGSDAARQWRQTYEILASRPNLDPAYVIYDKFDNPVFYVIRNHGYALR